MFRKEKNVLKETHFIDDVYNEEENKRENILFILGLAIFMAVVVIVSTLVQKNQKQIVTEQTTATEENLKDIKK